MKIYLLLLLLLCFGWTTSKAQSAATKEALVLENRKKFPKAPKEDDAVLEARRKAFYASPIEKMEQRIKEMEQSGDVHEDELKFARKKLHTARLVDTLTKFIKKYEKAITSKDQHSIKQAEFKIKDFYTNELKDYDSTVSDLAIIIQKLKEFNIPLE